VDILVEKLTSGSDVYFTHDFCSCLRGNSFSQVPFKTMPGGNKVPIRVKFGAAVEGREPSDARLEMARGLFAKPDVMSHFSLAGSTLGSVPWPRFELTRIWQEDV
jgi:hypothetical protein